MVRSREAIAGAITTALVGSGAVLTLGAAPAQAATSITITPNPSYASEPFEGWGTSLVWFANATGGYPTELREELYQAVFGDEGLNLNIARYNIGGGNATDVPGYLRPGGAVDGWWAKDATGSEGTYGAGVTTRYADRNAVAAAFDPDNPDHYDWDADATQRWWIERLVQDERITHWEAFANSAPYFMTESGYVSGGFNANNEQLKPSAEADFATYLVNVTEHLESEYGIEFATIDPFNEPNTNYWGTTIPSGATYPTGGRQEGMHVGPQRQVSMINALDAELAKSGTTTDAVISAMDETNPSIFVTNWNAYPAEVREKVGQMNVHTYGTGDRLRVRDLAKQADTSLWMSEIEGNWVSGWNPLSMENGLGIASRINDDLRELEPNAWVLWQPVEDTYNMDQPSPRGENLNWGSIFIDLDCRPYTVNGEEVWKSPRRVALAGSVEAAEECSVEINSKYNTLRNYTHFISPGDALIPTTSTSTTAAVAADGASTTLVHSNAGTTEQTVVVDLSRYGQIDADATLQAYVTTQAPSLEDPTGNALVPAAPVAVDAQARTATFTVPAKSVTTLVIDGVSGVADDAAAFQDGHTYQLLGTQSGKALTAGTTGTTIATASTVAPAASQQAWTVHEVSAEGNDQGATRQLVLSTADGRVLAGGSSGVTLVERSVADAQADPATTWTLNTTDGQRYTLVNLATATSLDVNGQSTADGTSVGLWQSNGGANQSWTARDLAALPVQVAVRTNPGVEPVLPTQVSPTYAWGTQGAASVTWDAVDPASWQSSGTFTVAGTATDAYGQDFTVTATVEVAQLTLTDPVSITVFEGISAADAVAQLPSTVPARAGASELAFDVPVTWASSAVTDADLAQTGVVTVSGTAQADGTELPATASIIVTAASGRNIAPLTTTTATASSTEGSYSVNNTRNGNRTDKGWSNWVSTNKPTTSTLTYSFPETSINGADVYYYRDGGFTWAASTLVEYRTPAGSWVALPAPTNPAPLGQSGGSLPTGGTVGPILTFPSAPVTATGLRVVMTAQPNTHLVVSEVEIFEVSAAPSDISDLAVLRADGVDVPLVEGQLDYTLETTGGAFPVLQAVAVDQGSTVEVVQPSAANDGVGTITVTSPAGTSTTYTVTVHRTIDLAVAFDRAAVAEEELTAVVAVDPSDAELTYEWSVDGEVVDGATGATYVPTVIGSTVTVTVTASGEGITGASRTVETTVAANPVLPVVLDRASATVGTDVEVSVSRLVPGAEVTLELHSEPVELAVLTAGEDGTVTATVTIPADATPGSHEIVATSGEQRGTAALTVLAVDVPVDPTDPTDPVDPTNPVDPTDPGTPGTTPTTGTTPGAGGTTAPGTPSGSLSSTGADVAVVAIGALALIGAGAGIAVVRRRRGEAA